MTVDDLKIIRANLNLNDPGDAAIYACIAVGFYCAARLGELTVPNLRENFDPKKYITRKNFSALTDQHGLPVMKFHLPITKCEPRGEDIQCAPQTNCITDPQFVLDNHFRLNPAPRDAHLFAWKHPKNGLRPLSRTQVTNKLTEIAKRHKLADLKGHSLRIGGTLFYLLKGVPFDVVKVIGRWAGESFVLYLRLHALILAPYLQTNKQVFDNFVQIAMPPVR